MSLKTTLFAAAAAALLGTTAWADGIMVKDPYARSSGANAASGAAFMGLMSGVYFYWPKMFGRKLSEFWGWISWALLFVGVNVTFFPMHFLGAMGMPRRTWQYGLGVGYDFWNLIATIGAFTIATGFLVTLVSAIHNALTGSGEAVGEDPWDAATLEWSMPSPPPHYNYKRLPTVHSDRPLWDEKHEGGPAVRQAVIGADAPAHVEMPPPSYWPLFTGIFQALLFVGFMVGSGGGGFDSDAFMNQVMFQVPMALLMLVGILMWVREDATPR